MSRNALPFPNYAAQFPSSTLNEDLVVRMFGAHGVCVGDNPSPCALTPAARAWLTTANANMAGGHCEGFAVLSSLMASKTVDPTLFGGADARSLNIYGNEPLQRELAYWFSTQLVQDIVGKLTQSYSANNVMPFLASALAPGSDHRWRLGIVRNDHGKLTGGHSLLPIAYTTKSDGIYELRVYDNNTPDHERVLTIDTNANRWEYAASGGGSSKLYYGDGTNKNPLYFAPIWTRVGTLPCPFCGHAGTSVSTTGGLQPTISDGSGRSSGVQDGTITEALGDHVSMSYSDLYDSAPGFTISSQSENDFAISLRPSDDDPASGTGSGGVTAFGPNHVVRAHGISLSGSAPDSLDVKSGGQSVTYSNSSGTSLTLSSVITTMSGKTLALAATLTGPSKSVQVTADPSTGAVSATAMGAKDTAVTVQVTVVDNATGTSSSSQVDFTAQGDNASFHGDTGSMGQPGGSFSGTVDTGNGNPPTPVTGHGCEGSDVGCGGSCAVACDVGQKCKIASDCSSNACNAGKGICVAGGCFDGVKSGKETDVDCGGADCGSCADGQSCSVAQDCVSGLCAGQKCATGFAIGAVVNGLPAGDRLTLQDNGGDDLVAAGNGSYQFAQKVAGPYAVTISQPPSLATCVVANGSGTATGNVTVQVNCSCHTGYAGSDCAACAPGYFHSGAACILAPTGGTITTVAGYRIHTFTTNDTFQTTTGIPVDYLIVGGGGGGGSGDGGGGGAGGLLTGTAFALASGSYPVVVGAGGAGASSLSSGDAVSVVAQNGSNSSFASMVAVGGGFGGSEDNVTGAGPANTPGTGGSGGGFGGANGANNSPGAAGTPGQGNAGGTRFSALTPAYYGMGGGGGAGGVGGNGDASYTGGAGGVGVASSITGMSVYYAGGGGGSGRNGSCVPGLGGQGGGGNGGQPNRGGPCTPVNGTDGAPNTGGGGGGGGDGATLGGNGGSGIVIIRYPYAP